MYEISFPYEATLYLTLTRTVWAKAVVVLDIDKNTQNYTHQKEIVSEIDDTKEIPDVTFPINLKLIEQYQRIDPMLMGQYKEGMYHNFLFVGEGIYTSTL